MVDSRRTLPDGTLHITIIDAAGHGVACTRTAINVSHTIRTLALEGHPPALLLPADHSEPT